MIKINANSNIPIYEQIIEGYKEHILQGHLKPGDIIPSVRRLAADIGVNPNTAGKAYSEMERLGIINTRRGKGAYVSDTAQLHRSEALFLRDELRRLTARMRGLGFSDAEIFDALETVLK